MSDCPMCGMNCGDTCYRHNTEEKLVDTFELEAELSQARELLKECEPFVKYRVYHAWPNSNAKNS